MSDPLQDIKLRIAEAQLGDEEDFVAAAHLAIKRMADIIAATAITAHAERNKNGTIIVKMYSANGSITLEIY